MVNIFVVRHKQPQDVPFTKSLSYQQIKHNKYQNTGKLTSIVILLCMSTLYYGLCLSMISAINSTILKKYFGTWAGETSTVGLLIGFFPIGGAIGALSGRFFIKYFTRKYFYFQNRQILIIFDIVAIITTGLLQIPNIGLLLALRIVQGIIVGVFMVIVPLYVNELVPIDLHGSEGVVSQILIVVGVVIDYVWKVAFTASEVNQQFFWRFVFVFTGLPCIIQLIFLLLNYIPESPISLIQKGQMDQAKVVLGKFNIPEVLNDVLAEMIHLSKKSQMKKVAALHGFTPQMSKKHLQTMSERMIVNPATNASQEVIKQAIDSQTNRILSSILQVYGRQTQIQPQVHKILSEHHINFEPVPHLEQAVSKKALIIGFELHFMQQFSGIKTVITETAVLFTNYNQVLSLYSPLIANVAQLIATCISTCVLSRFGRKNPTLVGNIMLSFNNFILAALFLANVFSQSISLVWAAFAFIILFEIIYALSIGPVVWPYVPEIMPAKYVPIASSMNWIASAICVIATPYILDAVGSPYPVFFFFGGILLLFFLINVKFLIETKGLTPTQIAKKLQK